MANKKSNKGKVMGITAALTVAAIGAYFLYGSDEGKKRRKQIKGWALKAKGEVLEQLENLKEVNEETYEKTVDMVAKKYRGLKNINPKELTDMVKELKGHWKKIKKSVTSSK